MNGSAPSRSVPSPARAASFVLPEGAIFAGRYRIVSSIAVGGMGAVYEVVHTETERRRALKVMHPHLFQSEEMRERFKREARIAAQIESEYIVDVSDAGVDEATRTPFIVMELLQGEDLAQRMKRLGRLPPGEVLTYLQQVGLALDKTHARSIVHRDLKPENVFLTTREDGSPRVKILDFGVAKLIAEEATSAGATRSLGTPLYMAPEQFRLGAPLQAAADIYALGMMAFTLLVGQPYWTGEAKLSGDVIAFAMVVVLGPQESAVRRAAQSGVTLPPGFDAWFSKTTAPVPGDRYPSASEAVRALAAALAPSAPALAPSAAAPSPAAPAPSPVAAPIPAPARPAPPPAAAALVAPAAPSPSIATAVFGSAPLPAAPLVRPSYTPPPPPPPPPPPQTASHPSSGPPPGPRTMPIPPRAPQPVAPSPPQAPSPPAAPPSSTLPSSGFRPSAPATSPAPALSPAAWSSGPASAAAAPALAVAAPPRERGRAPLIVAGALFGVVVLGGAAWALFGAADAPSSVSPASPDDSPNSAAAPNPTAPPASAASTGAPPTDAPTSSASSTSAPATSAPTADPPAPAAPTTSVASSTIAPSTTGAGARPAPSSKPKPTGPSPVKTARPLLGRD